MRTASLPETNSFSRLAWVYFGGVMLAYCVVILSVALPPTFVDYPMWAYEGILLHGVMTGHPVAGYVLKHYPIPQSVVIGSVGLLNLVFRWNLAIKLFLCLYLLLASVASWRMWRALRGTSPLVLFALPTIAFLNLDLWWGHISFEVGMCVVLILIAEALQKARNWVLALLLLCTFLSHMEACACAFLFLGFWMLSTRQWKRVWIAVPTLLLTGWYAAGRILGGNVDAETVPEAASAYGSKLFLIFKASSYFKIFGYVNARTTDNLSQSEAILGRPLFVVMIACSLLIGGLCLYAMVRAGLKKESTERRPLQWFVLALLVLAAFVPQIFLGSSDPGSRLVTMAAAAGLFLVEWKSFAGKAIAALAVLFCVVNFWQFVRIEANPYLPGHVADLPAPLLHYGQVIPSASVIYYEHLQDGKFDLDISSTALFLRRK